MLNKQVLIYQKFQEPEEPIPPFVGTVVADYLNRWGVEYQLLDGTYKTRRINKGCVSSKSLNHYLERVKFKKPKVIKRNRLKIKPRK